MPAFPPTTPQERQAYDASIVRSLVIAHQDRQGLDIDDDGHSKARREELAAGRSRA